MAVLIVHKEMCIRDSLDPDSFAQGMEILMDAGASIVGGCCGTTPAHLAALRRVADRHPTVAPPEIDVDAAAGERGAFFLTDDLEPSPLIDCDSNLPDALIEAEDDYNVARVRIAAEEMCIRDSSKAAESPDTHHPFRKLGCVCFRPSPPGGVNDAGTAHKLSF